MSTIDRLALARDYIAKGDEYYAKAADEIIGWLGEDSTRSYRTAADRVGRDESWVRRLVRSRTNAAAAPDAEFKVDWQSGDYEKPAAKRVLADPEQRKQVLASLPADQIEDVIQEAHGVVLDRLHARQAEQGAAPATPTAGELMGDERFDPSESWADADIIRVREKAHSLRRHVEKWGLVLGSMDDEQAFAYLQEAERNIAEARVVLQERMADRSRAQV